MKIVKFAVGSEILWGKLQEESDEILTNADLCRDIESFEDVMEMLADQNNLAKSVKREIVTLLAPVMPTKNILCIGKNYYEHILEFDGNADDVDRAKETPIFFSKALSSVTGHECPVYLHENVCADVDYEAELAVIIGKRGINISREDALDYVYGYSILNDVTSRNLQNMHQQWFKGKSLDTHCPIGPWIVTADEIEDGNELGIRSIINGEVMQDANTRLMIHDIKALIVQLSKGMTLNPGDVISTGTPKGVGMGFNPPRYLKDGDVMEIEIENIGTLRNKVVSSL